MIRGCFALILWGTATLAALGLLTFQHNSVGLVMIVGLAVLIALGNIPKRGSK